MIEAYVGLPPQAALELKVGCFHDRDGSVRLNDLVLGSDKFGLRDINIGHSEAVRDSIRSAGFARQFGNFQVMKLASLGRDGREKHLVFDGNHRLHALRSMCPPERLPDTLMRDVEGFVVVPCSVYKGIFPHLITLFAS